MGIMHDHLAIYGHNAYHMVTALPQVTEQCTNCKARYPHKTAIIVEASAAQVNHNRTAAGCKGGGKQDMPITPEPKSTYDTAEVARVAALIRRLRMTQRQIARTCDVSEVSLSEWLRGDHVQQPRIMAAGEAGMAWYEDHKDDPTPFYAGTTNKVSALMERLVVSQTKLAQELGITHTVCLGNWLRGVNMHRPSTVAAGEAALAWYDAHENASTPRGSALPVHAAASCDVDEAPYNAEDAHNVSALMERLKMSQSKLGKELGVSPGCLNAWLRGINVHSPGTLAAGEAAMKWWYKAHRHKDAGTPGDDISRYRVKARVIWPYMGITNDRMPIYV